MSYTQTVEIPPSRRLIIDLPLEIPAGKAQVEVKVIPPAAKEGEKSEKMHLTKQMIDEMLQNSPHTRALTGILHTDMTVEEIREERIAKYLQ